MEVSVSGPDIREVQHKRHLSGNTERCPGRETGFFDLTERKRAHLTVDGKKPSSMGLPRTDSRCRIHQGADGIQARKARHAHSIRYDKDSVRTIEDIGSLDCRTNRACALKRSHKSRKRVRTINRIDQRLVPESSDTLTETWVGALTFEIIGLDLPEVT